jgi:ATP-dependent 26S proteasome regulatory subunit
MASNLKTELLTHIKAKYSILSIQTAEEQRTIRIINEISTDPKTVHRTVYIGSITKGLYEAENERAPDGSITQPMQLLNAIEQQQSQPNATPSIYVLLDMQLHIDNDPNVRRKLRDLHTQLKAKASTIIMISPQVEVHAELQKVVTVFDLPLPDKSELENILCDRIHALKDQVRKLRDEITSKPERAAVIQKQLETLVPTSEKLIGQATDNKDQIVSALQGLTSIEADNVVAKNIVLKDISIATILQEKKQIVKKSGALDYWETDETQENIGGLANLKKWSASARNRFSEKARKYGITPPKGVLLIGVPGTGKSLSAKAMANLFKVPLLTLTMAQMTSKFYGETGNRMMSAIRLAQAMSPCIVLIDEIDKSFGTGQGGEHEESARTRGALLTAMEESTGIFWLATCNQPEQLAPELLARFPVMFHVDLPAPAERTEIFSIHLRKINRDPANFDLQKLVSHSEGYVGREIRNALQEALGAAFDQDTEITTDHIITALRKIVPTAVQRKEMIDKIRRWSERNAQPANEREERKQATATSQEEIFNRELEV